MTNDKGKEKPLSYISNALFLSQQSDATGVGLSALLMFSGEGAIPSREIAMRYKVGCPSPKKTLLVTILSYLHRLTIQDICLPMGMSRILYTT